MINKTKFELPEPVDGVDFYVGEIYEYTVCIEVCVEGLEESHSEASVCYEAVHKFRNGVIDGDATVVHSEHVRDVELCFDTDEPFDHVMWQKAKLLELGLNSDGNPLRPHERDRPDSERTLDDYTGFYIRSDDGDEEDTVCNGNGDYDVMQLYILLFPKAMVDRC